MSEALHITRMYVERCQSESGSWIVPPLDNTWPEYTQLSWKLGVIYFDLGLDITLTRFKTNWCITTKKLSFGGPEPGPDELSVLWVILNHFSAGYEVGLSEVASLAASEGRES